jgi:flagellar hook-basal body complex protein FliE
MADIDMQVNQLLTQMKSMAEAAKGAAVATPMNPGNKADFSALLKQSIDQVNELQQTAGNMSTAFERGDPNVTLPEVMVALQKANVSFQAVSQVRNKLLSAYQDIMSMPI